MTVPLFTLDSTVTGVFQDGVDTIIDTLGRPCKLVFDGAKLPCPNCLFDSRQERSSGVYNGTGPVSFTHPPCPVCRGTGYDPASLEVIEYRTFLVQRNIKPSTYIPPAALIRPATIARIKGYVTDMPLVIQAKYIVLDYQNALYETDRYVKLSEATPQGSIVPGRYFECFLQRYEP